MPRGVSKSIRTRSPATRRTGLQDIARELNISVSLVSKVLNNRLGTTGASQVMVKAIHDKAVELDYRKNATATSLASGRQNAIGVFVHRHGVAGSNISAEMVEGVAAAAARLHQRLVLQYYTTVPELSDLLPLAHRNAVDGLILGGVPHKQLAKELRAMHSQNMPVVTIHDGHLHPEFVNIGIDQPEVMRVATDHLLRQGCRHIAHVGVETYGTRDSGYAQALQEHGVLFRPELTVNGTDFTAASGEAAIERLLRQGVAFDAVVGESDQHTVGVMKALLKAGIRVPEQVKLIGIDNSPFCDFFIVPLSSVSQEEFRRGELAVEALTRMIDGQTVESVSVAPVLHPRESTGV